MIHRVAYLVNQYPKVSHTFIRREILALEKQGITVDRYALRGWQDSSLVDAEDLSELEKTRFVQKGGIGGLILETLGLALRRPVPFLKSLAAALAMSRKAVRPWPYHLAYFAQACRLSRWIEESGATHLHAHFGTNPAEIAYLVRKLGGPAYSFTIHGQDEIEGAKHLHFPEKVGAAKFVVAISAYCRSQILREIPHRDWERLKVVHCGLDDSYFDDGVVSLENTAHFLTVGRLSPEKGHLVLLDAFAALRATHPQAKLTCAGDGPMREEITARIAALGLNDAIEITGWVDAARIRSELDKATALVQPSFIEGLPVVIMEAMARKRPVISTYVAGIPELVTAETGWLVPAGEITALAVALRDCLDTPDDRLREMGLSGQVRARERHSVAREAKKLAHLFSGETP